MEYQNLVNKFEESYRQIFEVQKSEGSISWAQHKKSNPNELVSPTIPFVGKNCAIQRTKILLYSSAENLSDYMNKEKGGWLDEDAKAINRHRWYKDHTPSEFFPWVHISPITDGSLLIVLKYICEQLGIDMPTEPKEFVESIAFANFGKFSIQSGASNVDYAQNKSKLDCSMPYVEQDLKLLKPDIIVMFKTIYATERSEIDRLKGDARIIGLTQINARTVNTNLKRRYALKDESELSPVIRDWYDKKHFYTNKFTNKTHKNFLSVFTYLDNILKQK